MCTCTSINSNFYTSLFTFSSELGDLVVESALLGADAVGAAVGMLLDFLGTKCYAVCVKIHY